MSRPTREELLEAIQGLSRKELRLLVDTLKKKLSLPPEEEEEQEWPIIPSSLTITLTGYKPDADKRAITMLIRYYTYQNLSEIWKFLNSNDFPIVIARIFEVLPHDCPPILKKFEDLGAIITDDYDWGNYIE